MTNRNRDSEKQHYVSEVVLSLYAEGAGKGKLCVFDKHTGRPLPGPMAVKKLCKEGGFYNADAAHGKVSLETAFHHLETDYREIAAKVIAARSLAPLTPQEFGTLISFVCVQFLRVPRIRKAFEQVTKLVADRARAMAPKASNLHEFEFGENELRLRHLEVIAKGAVEGTRVLANYAWFVMEAETGQPLWISDCPVVMHNDEKSFYAGLGFAAPGVQIYFPITPSLQLVCWHPMVAGIFLKEHGTSNGLLGRLKGELALGIKANKASIKTAIDNMEKMLGPINEIVAAIKTGGSVRASAENVRHFNWLQFQWSYRFILCAEGKFDLAAKMLREHPELRTGKAMRAS
ncbi:MAG: DUF4238 domain-containing protein [Hyphomicrobium sp.]